MAKHMAPQGRQSTRRRGMPLVPMLLTVVGVACAAGIVVFMWGQKAGKSPAATGAADAGSSAAHTAGQDAGSADATGGANANGAKENGAAEPLVASELARLLNQGKITSIRLIGDSITAGFGTDGYVDSDLTGEGLIIYDDGAGDVHRETPESAVCWANEFRRYASTKGVTSFVNAGINGAFMRRLAEHPDAWLADGADVVFVGLGTNDAGYYGPDEYRAFAEQGLAAAAQKSKLVVVLSPVNDLRPESQLVEPAASLGDVLREVCAQNGYLFVDMRDAVTPQLFNDDGLHPSSDGSLAMWRHIQETLL